MFCCPEESDHFACTALIESDDKQQKSVNLQACVGVYWYVEVFGMAEGDKNDILYMFISVSGVRLRPTVRVGVTAVLCCASSLENAGS